jgi:putative nucleotidyltransferase-like protein
MSSDLLALGTCEAQPLTDVEQQAWRSAWQRWLGGDEQLHPTDDPRDAPRLRLLAKSANGLGLDAEEQAVLRHWEHATEAYRGYLGKLAEVASGCVVLKGLSLARLYPSGWIRSSGDVDMYAPASTDLWAACRLLDEEGWDLDLLLAVEVDDEPGLVVVFVSRCSQCGGKLEISVSGLGSLGDALLAPPQRRLPVPPAAPDVAQLVPLLWERFERPFTLRDVFDCWLIWRAHADREDLMWQVVDAVDLWPEYQQLLETGGRHDAPVPPAPEGLGQRAGDARRARERRRRARLRSRPGLAYLAGRALAGRRDNRRREVGSAIIRRLCPPAAVFDAGLPVSGARLDTTPAPLALRARGGRLTASTPLGRVELSHVPDVRVGASDMASPGAPLDHEPSTQGGGRR